MCFPRNLMTTCSNRTDNLDTPTDLRLSLYVPHFSDEGPEDDNDQGRSYCIDNAYGQNR